MERTVFNEAQLHMLEMASHIKTTRGLEELKDQLCACEYDISDSVLADLEIYLYLGQSANELEEISQILREKIEAYYEAAGIEKVSNLNWQLRPVSKHQAMGLN